MNNWKKWICSIGVVTALLWTFAGVLTAAEAGKALMIGLNDTIVEFPGVQPYIHKGNVFVPAGVMGKAMKLRNVKKDGNVQITDGKKKLNLIVNGSDVLIRQGEMMIPLRSLAKTFGYGISPLADGEIYRLANKESKLSNVNFVKKYSSLKPTVKNEAKGKVIYFTFDDGPTESTPKLLAILKQYNAKGTFFMLGNRIAGNPKIVKQMAAAGHGLGLHGMSHVQNKFYSSPAAALKEMNQDNEQLYKAVHVKTTLIRTPNGSKPYFLKSFRDKVLGAGYHLWDWNVDSNDWRYADHPQRIAVSVLKDIHAVHEKGVPPVVLFHDHSVTVKVLPQILKQLQSEGYTFRALTPEMKPMNFWNDFR